MKTLLSFESAVQSIPQSTAWYLADLGEYLGKQELYMRQVAQKLKALKEHAIIESAVSSNRIEGVTVEPARVREVVFGRTHLHDRRIWTGSSLKTASVSMRTQRLHWISSHGITECL